MDREAIRKHINDGIRAASARSCVALSRRRTLDVHRLADEIRFYKDSSRRRAGPALHEKLACVSETLAYVGAILTMMVRFV